MNGDALCRKVGIGLGMRTLFANVDGAVFTFLLLEFVTPSDRRGEAPLSLDIVAFVALLVVAIVVIGLQVNRLVNRDFAWIVEERTPTDVERDRTLSLPARLSLLPLTAWAVGAVLFGPMSMAFGHSAGDGLKIVLSVVLGGLVTAAIAYLLNERCARPVFVLALADGSRPTRTLSPSVRTRLILTWALVSGVPLAGVAVLPLEAHGAEVNANINGAVVVLSLVALVGGAVSTIFVAKTVAEPLADVRRALAGVEAGDLGVDVAVDDGGEVGMLQTGVNRMVAGLRERSRLADLFGRHVGAEVAALALEQGTGLASEQREASVLFVDLVGSTAMAEILPPAQVVETLNAFFATVVRVVGAEGGWVNKFEGDGALCVFGAPATQPDHAARALRAARTLRAELRRLSVAHPGIDAAVGVSSGTVVAGNVGTESRYEYTVIGQPVNEAARLTDLAKDRASRVLASGDAVARSGDEAARWADLGTVALRGRQQPTAIAEPAVTERV